MRTASTPLRANAVAMLAIPVLAFFLSVNAPAQTFSVLHNFGVLQNDGNIPYSGLTLDPAGNLYGTTMEGGTYGFGTVYRLSPAGNGSYQETVLYSFKGGPSDGANPHAPLLRDGAGNLYSTTVAGGISANICNPGVPSPGCGVVFKLSPTASGEWNETVLFKFNGANGGNPFSGLVVDSKGNVYGTTLLGGSNGLGTVYQLSRTSSGLKQTVLHNFTGGADGAEPFIDCETLALDSKGNVYGSTYKGGAANAGTVFRLTQQASGTWVGQILYTFKGGADGNEAFSGVILDKSGNVYGTTLLGGSTNNGTVFELNAANNYAKTILHNFSLGDPAETFPNGLIFDASGNLYGTTEYAVFKLTPGPTGWTETALWSDLSGQGGGNTMFAPVTMGPDGSLYGTTIWGGEAGSTTGGTAFKLAP